MSCIERLSRNSEGSVCVRKAGKAAGSKQRGRLFRETFGGVPIVDREKMKCANKIQPSAFAWLACFAVKDSGFCVHTPPKPACPVR